MNKPGLLIFLILGLVAAVRMTSGAGATLTVCAAGCDFATIQAGVAGAGAGDTLALGGELFVENVIITKPLTLVGAGAALTVVDGNNHDSVIEIGPGTAVTLTGLTLTHGSALVGGGLYNRGQATVIATTIAGNLAGAGGGIYNAAGGELTVRNSTIMDNTALDGAGVYISGTASLDDVTFVGNTAVQGGGLYVGGQATVVDSTFDDSLAGADGGAVYNGGTLSVTASLLRNNVAEVGGAIFNVAAGVVALDLNTFEGNVADNGGGLFNAGEATISAMSFAANIGIDGGAIHNAGFLVVTGTLFDANQALFQEFFVPANGGAIFNSGDLTVSHSTFNDNLANFGGAIAQRGSATVAESVFYGNSVLDFGGMFGSGDGAAVSNSGPLRIEASHFEQNQAERYGGAIANGYGGQVLLLDSTLTANVAALWGGGIFGNELSEGVTVINSTLSGNRADFGGAVFTKSALTLVNATFSGNSADFAGAIYNDSGYADVTNTIITAGDSDVDCYGDGAFVGDHNLPDDASCGFPAHPVTHLAGALADNGGPTNTHALLPGSNAIDSGDGGACPGVDQRGVARPQDGDDDGAAACDIGAFEQVFAPLEPQIYFPVVSGQGESRRQTAAWTAGQ